MRVLRQSVALDAINSLPSRTADAVSPRGEDRIAFRLLVKTVDARLGSPWTNRIEAPLWGLQQARRRSTMSNKPSHYAYVVVQPERRNDKAVWHRIANVWPHTRGNGFDLVIPPGVTLSGRIVCVEPKVDDAAEAEAEPTA